jgi:hypothetical protein
MSGIDYSPPTRSCDRWNATGALLLDIRIPRTRRREAVHRTQDCERVIRRINPKSTLRPAKSAANSLPIHAP